MSVLDTKNKRKSAGITKAVLLLLLYLIFNYGMDYIDPPVEYGIAINYGISDQGRTQPKVVENVKATPKPLTNLQELKEETSDESIKKEFITTQDQEAPLVETSKKEPKTENPKEEVKEEKPKPKKPSKKMLKAFDDLLKGDMSDGQPKTEGNDKKNGVKGDKDGNPKSSKYYGNQGSDKGDPNYNLLGREALKKPIEQPNCQEEGTVVVRIEVDQTGKVIKAIPGVKGTTNSAKCLLEPAKIAALKTTWNASKDAPSKQKGTIIYKFTLIK